MNRTLYTLLLYALLPFVPLRLFWRARKQPAYLRHIGERIGFYRSVPAARRAIWIHAVSVGETRAAEPLVRALSERYPDHRILITHMTPTGRETGELLFGADVERCYLPYDYPGAVRRFLAHFEPAAGILMETELWPNLIHAAAMRNVPVYLVNARLSEKSYAGYRRHAALARGVLQDLAGIAAQTEADAQRLRALGARHPRVTGNLKFDIVPPPALAQLGAEWRASYGDRPVLLAASTRAGEEELLLDAFERMAVPHALLVIVPRHPDRFDEVAALVQRRGFAGQRRSSNSAVPRETAVLLGDSLGEMFAYYAACDVAFIGGSLLPYGSQNLIEACAVGKPVLIGPSTYNFAEAAQLAIECGAALSVADVGALAARARELLTDKRAASRMGEAAMAFSRAHQGAVHRVLELVRF
jgi:3-deoxy-D-manno-octulosonic-acid transferase